MLYDQFGHNCSIWTQWEYQKKLFFILGLAPVAEDLVFMDGPGSFGGMVACFGLLDSGEHLACSHFVFAGMDVLVAPLLHIG